MKIYTKKGDAGKTSLIGGDKVDKDHIRLEAYGTIDELNSWIGLLRDREIPDGSIVELLEIQDRLFTIGSHLAATASSKMTLPDVYEKDIKYLEKAIDKMEEVLKPMTHFILPGGHPTVSECHIARCVCRRAERNTTTMIKQDMVRNPFIGPYLNRLSDYLFVLSRFLSHNFKALEQPWTPKTS